MAHKPGARVALPELVGHDGAKGAADLRRLGELVQIPTGLGEDDIDRHRVGEGVEVDRELVHAHFLVHCPLPIHGHDSNADEEVEGVGDVVGPASLPDAQGVLQLELPLQAD